MPKFFNSQSEGLSIYIQKSQESFKLVYRVHDLNKLKSLIKELDLLAKTIMSYAGVDNFRQALADFNNLVSALFEQQRGQESEIVSMPFIKATERLQMLPLMKEKRIWK